MLAFQHRTSQSELLPTIWWQKFEVENYRRKASRGRRGNRHTERVKSESRKMRNLFSWISFWFWCSGGSWKIRRWRTRVQNAVSTFQKIRIWAGLPWAQIIFILGFNLGLWRRCLHLFLWNTFAFYFLIIFSID